ncbi:GNAT family N-acetyltransferase [Mycobacterium sp. SMC-2]|uniref:GNAT family N-acetyltransferase n=1 Tax=Mycobacterium sp. SMC-2 TaxID=2857058 RepID=UPI0021B4091B|nr:GNAT family N-acetyltransferase [Mycobacterium sp. SMC-2]UXA08863.1 GNAT family N-acetyltransferase [Mycobacterium sp. SMC-2]
MEPLTRTVRVVTTDSVEVQQLADVAARTFPLACPASVAPENIAAFVDANLSAARFAEYLADPQRAILTAEHDDRIIGYAMLIREDDTAELSKIYVAREHHGTGVATALMDLALATAGAWGVGRVWLGVNQANERAQRFYAKNGFTVSGTRTFQVGAGRENDFVMSRGLR